MADEARKSRNFGETYYLADATVNPYSIRQGQYGQAEVLNRSTAALANETPTYETRGEFEIVKTTGITILKGGRVYFDYSARTATYKKVNDRDFYLGRATQDSSATTPTVRVALNEDPKYDLELTRDSFTTTITGTQALGGLALNRRGGALDAVISATSEAQKLDALSLDGIAAGLANAIIEFAFCVPSDGAGTVVDVSVGIASATHATDADAIAQHLFMHLDANATAIKFQSKDGTTTVAATDSTTTYTEGQTNTVRKEVWFDCRNPADVQIYVDGVLVLDATTFNVSAAALTWLLLFHIEKTASTDTYEFLLEWLRARFAEQ